MTRKARPTIIIWPTRQTSLDSLTSFTSTTRKTGLTRPTILTRMDRLDRMDRMTRSIGRPCLKVWIGRLSFLVRLGWVDLLE